VIGEAVILAGALLTLLSAVGVVRFRDALARMHALTKASTIGFGLVAIGACLSMDNIDDITSVLLAVGLQVISLPVAATLIAHSTYWARRIDNQLDGVDELQQAVEEARRRRARQEAASQAEPDEAG
jgi:multicomponent Na+:H+ antiporter subunit G